MRPLGITLALSLLAAASVQADEGAHVVGRKTLAALQKPAHDPNCPGCRAFLAGYAPAEHGPSCNCAPSGAGGEGGAGGGAGGGEAAGLGEDLYASGTGAGYGYESSAPGMIGDFFGGTYQMFVPNAGQTVPTNVSIAGGDRRFKIAENYSPFPMNRVFFNYNHFHNALLTADARNANYNRGVLGAETTFFDDLFSFEFRLPFGTGLNSTQIVDPTANNVTGEFGNIAFALKGLLYQTNTLAASAGLGVVVPTGPDTTMYAANDPLPFVIIHNESVFVQPFVGLWWTPNSRLFGQFAGQVDVDVSGSPVEYPHVGSFTGGKIQDQTMLYLDTSFGYWLFRNPGSDAFLTGIAPMIELHYNSTLQNSDAVNASDGSTSGGPPVGPADGQIRNFKNRQDVLNLTGALRLELASCSYLTLFGVAPLRSGDNKVFDAEFGVQYSRLY